MKKLAAASWLFSALTLFLAGCASRTVNPASVERHIQDYNRTWSAVEDVMSKHFLIRYAERSEGTIVSAPIRSDGRMASAMTVVRARILASKDGGYDVEVRAENYIETSEPAALSKQTQNYHWQPAGFDKRLETQLLREIDEARFNGKQAAHRNTFLESPDASDELPTPD